MTAVPQLDLPDILVDDEEDRAKKDGKTNSSTTLSPITPGTESLMKSLSSFLSPTRDSTGSNHQKKLSTTSADLTLQTNFDSFNAHPLSMPRTGSGGAGEGPSSPSLQRGSGGGLGSLGGFDGHQSTHSAFSFELQTPGSGASSRRTSYRNSNRNSRSNSAVSPVQMSTILDDSIWVESIRRSATMKRPQQKW